jgi:acetylornithine deacetylase/succinyl-diaminopimelate desuccinylase-like protein
LYGRGLADDGYALFAALGAVEAAQKSGAPLPRVCILIEACEESGSPDLEYYVETLQKRISNPNIVITLDCEDRDGDRLWLTQSLRGLVNGFLTVETIPSTMHSGLASGVVPSTGRILRLLLSRIENTETGEILSEVVSPKLTPVTEAYAGTIAKNVPDFLDSYGMPANLRPSAPELKNVIANNLVRAALEVTGVSGQPSAESSGNVMVGSLTARLSIRIPPEVDPALAYAELKRVLESDPPYGARVTFAKQSSDWGWMARPFSAETEQKITKITQSLFGTDPGYLGNGASIPFIKIMTDAFPKSEHIVTGILSHDSRAHGPDENMNIRKVKRLTEFVSKLLVA